MVGTENTETEDRTYTMVLADDLYYSDGTPITAWDYAFSMLLLMAPEVEQIGGRIYRAEHIIGYDEYITKQVPYLSGVNVITDHQLVITLDHEFLPYFFETGLLLCVPYPIYVLAPGCKVYDDGYGIYIANEDKSVTEPIFTAELLKKTILDPETGYNSHPSVVSGPYVLLDYDGVTAHFQINPYFKGTMDGVVPTIERISFTVADNDTMVEDLQSGKFHLVNKVVYGPTITECLNAAVVSSAGTEDEEEDFEEEESEEELDEGESEEYEEEAEGDESENSSTPVGIRFQNYPRIGLMCLTFTFDWPTVHEMEVRQAIAWCMNRDQITKDYCGDYGIRVEGFYGIEQWEYQLISGSLSYPIDDSLPEKEREEQQAKWEELNLDNLTVYEVDTDRAKALLDQAGWTLNRNGEEYDPQKDDVRCKMVDGELVALDLKMMYPAGNHVVDTLQENFIDNLNACGILLTLVPADMQDLLYSFYRETERTTDMIYLATNFHVIVDPAIAYSTDNSANHEVWNNTYSDDEELYELAVDMRKTEPGAIYEYVEKWIKFQERFNEVLPTIPIYSNVYFDFWNGFIQNYNITAHVTWSQAILESYFGLEAIPEETEEDEFDDDDGVEYFDW